MLLEEGGQEARTGREGEEAGQATKQPDNRLTVEVSASGKRAERNATRTSARRAASGCITKTDLSRSRLHMGSLGCVGLRFRPEGMATSGRELAATTSCRWPAEVSKSC